MHAILRRRLADLEARAKAAGLLTPPADDFMGGVERLSSFLIRKFPSYVLYERRDTPEPNAVPFRGDWLCPMSPADITTVRHELWDMGTTIMDVTSREVLTRVVQEETERLSNMACTILWRLLVPMDLMVPPEDSAGIDPELLDPDDLEVCGEIQAFALAQMMGVATEALSR